MMLSIFIVCIVLLSVYFMLACSNTYEIKEVGRKLDNIDSKLLLYKTTDEVKYPTDKKDEEVILVNNNAITSALAGTLTINVEDIEDPSNKPVVIKKRKPRTKTRTCENCANFVPIKKPRKKKVVEDTNI